MSVVREEVAKALADYREFLQPDNKGWNVLEVGVDGDPKIHDGRPGASAKRFGTGNRYQTLDKLPRVKPDIVADITDTKLVGKQFDLIICVQTLEHIYEPKKAVKEMARILRKGGYVILDSPWSCQHHPQPDYDDYWRISPTALKRMMKEAGLEIIKKRTTDILTSALGRKP